jgi:5-formyltetrahydrofolate cyclo-ligase
MLADVPSREALRQRLRLERSQLSAAARIGAANAVVDSLEQLPEFLVDQTVAGYWAVAGELPLHAAVARLRSRGQNYCLPVLSIGQTLRFAPLLPNSVVVANRYGIPEPECAAVDLLKPEQLDLVLVPLTAFDRNGHRLGSGGGYYDRSFAYLRDASRPAATLLVGIGYAFQEVEQIDAQDWDVQLDFIATDKELIACTTAATAALRFPGP